MPDKRLEWFPFYYERFLLATKKWDTVEIGAYLLLLSEQWDTGILPVDPAKVREITRTHHRLNLDRVLSKFLTLEKYEEGVRRWNEGLKDGAIEPDTELKEALKTGDTMLNKTLYYIRLKQEGKSRTNSGSGRKGGLARAAKLANATDSLKHIEQNRTEIRKEESKAAPVSESINPQKNLINNSGAAGLSHAELMIQNSGEVDRWCMEARRLGLFPKDMPADKCRERMAEILREFQPKFDRLFHGQNFAIFRFKVQNHLEELARDPNRKPWEKPAVTTLNYNLPENPNAKK